MNSAMLLMQLIKKGVEILSGVYLEREAREMVFVLFEHILGTRRHTHIIEPSYEVGENQVAEIMQAFLRLADGEPLQYVIGKTCFYGRDFHVTPSVLIPRPETEILCRTTFDILPQHRHSPDPRLLDGRHPLTGRGMYQESLCSGRTADRKTDCRVLDLCTGSGCIAWTMALEFPGAEVTAVDISDAALEVARNQDFVEEMSRTGAVAPSFVKADVLAGPGGFLTSEALAGHDSAVPFDLILSNPPYVMNKEKALMRPNVLEHEPHLALFVPDDDPLVFYRAVARWSESLLAPNGTGIVEINEALGPETAQVFKDSGFTHTEILKDLTDRDRFVLFRQ